MLTVGDLRKIIQDIPDDVPILVEHEYSLSLLWQAKDYFYVTNKYFAKEPYVGDPPEEYKQKVKWEKRRGLLVTQS